MARCLCLKVAPSIHTVPPGLEARTAPGAEAIFGNNLPLKPIQFYTP